MYRVKETPIRTAKQDPVTPATCIQVTGGVKRHTRLDIHWHYLQKTQLNFIRQQAPPSKKSGQQKI